MLRRQIFGDPLIEVCLIDPSWIARLEVLRHLTTSDGLDDGAFAHQLRFEGMYIGRQAREVIAFGLETEEQVVERRHHLDPLRSQRFLPRSLKVVDSELLLTIRLGLQSEEALDQFGELLQPLWDCLEDVESVFVLLLSREHIGVNSTIQLRHSEGLREEAPHHPLWISFPLLSRSHQRQRGDDRDVALTQIADDTVACHHRDTAVGEVND